MLDDTEHAIRNRLEIYRRDTAPSLEHYRAVVTEVDGTGDLYAITRRLFDALE